MLRKILVPLDGSPRAERALPVAARLTRAGGDTVILVHATGLTKISSSTPVPCPAATPMQSEEEQKQAEQYLTQLATSPELRDIKIEMIIRQEEAASAILSTIDTQKAEMIVLCSHGCTGFTRWALGSVAERVVHHAHVPVLILREGSPLPMAPHPDSTVPFRVLVPLDGSVLAQAALGPAVTLATALSFPAQGALHLVRVIPPRLRMPGKPGIEEYEEIYRQARVYLERTIQYLRSGLVAPEVRSWPLIFTYAVIIDNNIASALVTAAENGNQIEGIGMTGRCDLIAMTTHGLGGLQCWTLGSVAERVLHESCLPLLKVRPSPQMVTALSEASQPRREE